MYRAFLPVEPDEVRGLRPETTPPRPRWLLPRAIFAAVTVGALIALVALLSFGKVRTGCPDAEGEILASIEHLAPVDDSELSPMPGCGVTYSTDAPGRDVLDNYAQQLTADGWVVINREDPDPSVTPPPDRPANDPEPRDIAGLDGSLEASRDGYLVTVVHDAGWSHGGVRVGWRSIATVYVLVSQAD